MPDQTTPVTTTTEAPQPKAKRTPKQAYTVSAIARDFLVARGHRKPSDAQVIKASKTVRGIIRTNKSALAKRDPAIKRHQKGADYGTLSRATRDAVVANRF